MLTVGRCRKIIAHSVDSAELESGMGSDHLINRAGVHLMSMFQWAWTIQRPVFLDIVADQDWCGLPDDFLQIVYLQSSATSNTGGIDLVDLQLILEARDGGGLNTVTPSKFMAAESHMWPSGGSGSLGGGEPVTILELYPTPTVSEDDTVRLCYRGRWRSVPEGSADGYRLTLPEYCETLFEELLRAFARGQEEEDNATLDQRLAFIEKGTDGMGGSVFLAAKRTDALRQPTIGPLRNGAADVGSRFYTSFRSGTIGAPT
jgi:hypothetical protein